MTLAVTCHNVLNSKKKHTYTSGEVFHLFKWREVVRNDLKVHKRHGERIKQNTIKEEEEARKKLLKIINK